MISDVFETGKPTTIAPGCIATTELPWGKSAARRRRRKCMDLDLRWSSNWLISVAAAKAFTTSWWLNFLDLWSIFFVAGTEEWEDWAQWGVWFQSGSQWVKGVPWFREVGRESHVNLRDIGWWIFMESWVRKFWNLVPRYGLYSWSGQLYPLEKLSCTICNYIDTWSGQLYPLKKLSCTILYV